MTKLSIVIPVYNTEKYLKKCLDSIFSQTFKDFEVICVDDGSTDNSLEVLKQFPLVRIIKKQNKGSGAARNIALACTKGEYVLFVDSDDWLVDCAFEKLIRSVETFNTDILIFGAFTYSNGKLRSGSYGVKKIPKKYLHKVFNKSDFKDEIFKFPSTAWTKLYKRNFLINNNINFQNIRVGQDQIFFVKSMLQANAIAVLNKNLYCYRKKRPGSVTSVKKKTTFSPVDVFWEVERYLDTCSYKYKRSVLNKYFLKATFWLPKMREDLKNAYYIKYINILKYLKDKYPNKWYRYFAPELHDSYMKLKLLCAACCLKKFFNSAEQK